MTIDIARWLTAALIAGCAGNDTGFDIQHVVGPAPDYIVGTLTDPPATAFNGDQIVVTTVVHNVGTADAIASSRTRYFVSSDPDVGGDIKVVQSASVPPLAVGASDSQAVTLRIPSVASGSYFVIACADRGAKIPELDERNNCAASATPVAVTGPDLVVELVGEPPAVLVAGDAFSIVDAVRNHGTADAASSAVGYFLSPSPVRGPGTYKLAPRRKTGPIAAGTISGGSVTATVPAVAPGTYYLVACADVASAVAESNDDNNCLASTTTTAIGGAGGMVIDTVATADGFTQIRQGDVAQLVISGSGLEATTTVMLGEIAATPVSVTATEVRADIWIDHGIDPGPRMLALADPGDTVVAADAIELTPFVVSPSGADDGHGTYQSPLNLCSTSLEDNVSTGDTVHVVAGYHACSDAVDLFGAATIIGDGTGTTIVGIPGDFGGFFLYGGPTTLRDMTIVAPWTSVELYGGGPFVVENLEIAGTGISMGNDAGPTSLDVSLAGYVVSGANPGLSIWGTGTVNVGVTDSVLAGSSIAISKTTFGTLAASATRIEGCGTGVYVTRGTATLDDMTIDSCDRGIQMGSAPVGQFLEVQLTTSDLVDNTIGVVIGDGQLEMSSTTIRDDETTTRASEQGILLVNGYLFVQGGTITGQDDAGIEAWVADSAFDYDTDMTLNGLVIEGGARGVYAHGFPDCASLEMYASTVRDQTVAAVSWGVDDTCLVDLAGGNHLSVLGGFALEDLRGDPVGPDPIIHAAGITLNGNSYSGVVQGPVSVAPDYRITGDGTIEF